MRYTLLLFSILSVAASSFAERAGQSYARVVVIRPHQGAWAEFEAGYKRHLDWHRANRDPWTWRGWTFMLGSRLDSFIDGTFDHTLEELDRAITPAADGADNDATVSPHAEFVSHLLLLYRPDLSRGTIDLQSRFMELSTVEVVTGREREFESALATACRTSGEGIRTYQLISGGPLPSYLIMRPRASWAELARSEAIDRLAHLSSSMITRHEVDVLSYRPDMSYSPETP